MQAASQTALLRISSLLCTILAFMFLITLVACSTTKPRLDHEVVGSKPTWVQSLRDPLQDLPELRAAEEFDHTDKTDVPRLGQPQELGLRFGSATPQNKASTETDRSGTSGGNVSGRDLRAQIDVNFNMGERDQTDDDQPDMRDFPSALELAYRGDLPARPDRALEQFGYASFRAMEAREASAPASADHVIGAGDELIIDLVTNQPRRFTPRVENDGTIEIPDLGTFTVGGKTIREIDAYMLEEVGRIRKNFELRVGLGTLMSIPIRVSGEVVRGGVIEIEPNGDLLDVLNEAGIRKSGSLRNIRIIHSSGESIGIDLYGYLLGLEPPPVVRLNQGDCVLIPAIGATIAVAGSVQRPGIYEVAHESELSTKEGIELAGGTTGFSVVDSIQIERTRAIGRELIDIQKNDTNQKLHDGDLILVGAVDGRLHPVVEARGALINPGRFQYRDGMTVGDLVRMSGGLEIDAYTSQAILSRLQGTKESRNNEYAAGARSTSRRVVIVNLENALRGDPDHDIALSPLDLLRVQRFSDAHDVPLVEVIGAVRRPGRYEQTADLRVGDLVALAGNLSSDAHRQECELIRRRRVDDSSILDVDRFRINLASILQGDTRGPKLENGDQIVIRRMRRADVRVEITGLVRFPGEYVLPAGSKITDLISAAGGLLQDADIRAARFTRERIRKTQLDRWSELTERNRQVIERVLEERVNSARSKEATAARIQMRQMDSLLGRLKNIQADGRVVIPFTDDDFPESNYNLALEQGDRLFIPLESNTVSVLGNVFNPLTVIHENTISADLLIDQAGGITELADEDRIYVVRANGLVEGVIQKSGNFKLSEPLLAGDIVLVPKRALDRDFGSVVLDLLSVARTTGEAAALWNLATAGIDEANVSVIAPAHDRGDPNQMNGLLDEFQRGR
jgi:polysaccharide export outer membrane protein